MNTIKVLIRDVHYERVEFAELTLEDIATVITTYHLSLEHQFCHNLGSMLVEYRHIEPTLAKEIADTPFELTWWDFEKYGSFNDRERK